MFKGLFIAVDGFFVVALEVIGDTHGGVGFGESEGIIALYSILVHLPGLVEPLIHLAVPYKVIYQQAPGGIILFPLPMLTVVVHRHGSQSVERVVYHLFIIVVHTVEQQFGRVCRGQSCCLPPLVGGRHLLLTGCQENYRAQQYKA